MKQILPLLLILSCFSIIQAQTEIKKGKNDNSEMSITLDEVEIIAYSRSEKAYRSTCCVAYVTECYSDGKDYSCNAFAKGVEIKTASLKEVNDVILYPNPSSSGIYQMNFNKQYNSIKVIINSISGQIIYSKLFQNITSKVTLDLSNNPSGIYIVNIIADSKILPTKKVIRG